MVHLYQNQENYFLLLPSSFSLCNKFPFLHRYSIFRHIHHQKDFLSHFSALHLFRLSNHHFHHHLQTYMYHFSTLSYHAENIREEVFFYFSTLHHLRLSFCKHGNINSLSLLVIYEFSFLKKIYSICLHHYMLFQYPNLLR